MKDYKMGLGIPIAFGVAAAIALRFFSFGGLETKLDNIEKAIREQPRYEMKTENVIGQESPEKFYEINGQRVYLEIDGKPIEQYFRK
jgi:hypothetical protein